MHLFQAIVLGIVQGLTEFLPVSSSAHLLIVPRLLGWNDPGVAFTAISQLGTLAAVLVYFRKDIVQTLSGMLRGRKDTPEMRLGLAVLVGTLPILVLALAFKSFIKGEARNLNLVAATQIVMALTLFAAERATKKTRPLEQVGMRDGVIVGLLQCLALIPGASRSGSTLIGAFLTGLTREAALRFSFLLSIPAVLISGLYELKDVLKPEPAVPGAPVEIAWTGLDIGIATVVAGIVGYGCIAWLLRYLARHSTVVFVIYRILLGLALFGLVASGLIQAR